MSKRPLDDYHDALSVIRSIAARLDLKADALMEVHQGEFASELDGMARDLHRAVQTVNDTMSDQLTGRVRDAETHSHTMLATILHVGEAVKRGG